MKHEDKFTVLSNLFNMCKTVEELNQVRNDVRGEVKSLPRDCQELILDEWNSARRMFDLPGIDEETQKQIEAGKYGIDTDRKKHERSRKQNRGSGKKLCYGEGYKLPITRDA